MANDTNADEYLVDEKRAAKMLGFTRRFLQARRIRGGGPPFIKISPRAVRYRLTDLEQWVEARVRINTSNE